MENDLKTYVSQNLKRSEVLDFMQRDFPQYKWSLATLDRRLRHFGIHYIDYDTPLTVVADAVQKELEGPGRLLGYRAMNQKLRTEHNVQVPRHLVYNMIAELDPEGLEARSLQRKKKKPKGQFTSEGPLWVASLDGHDKLCGYQNSTFPLGVYGCIDTFSRKILFLFVCHSNSNPLVVGKMYLQYLFEAEMLPRNLRVDRGTETGKMATIHVYLLNKHEDMNDPTDAIIYGPSTSNKIERWWRELHELHEEENMTHTVHSIDNCLLMCLYQLSNESVTYLLGTGILTEFEDRISWKFQLGYQTIYSLSLNSMEAPTWESHCTRMS